jgi:hypothetical protein
MTEIEQRLAILESKFTRLMSLLANTPTGNFPNRLSLTKEFNALNETKEIKENKEVRPTPRPSDGVPAL